MGRKEGITVVNQNFHHLITEFDIHNRGYGFFPRPRKKWENGDEINNAPLLDVIFLQMQIYNGKAIIFLSRILNYILNSVQDQLIGY